MTLPPTLSRWMTLVEKYVFSLFFLLLAYKQLHALGTSVALLGERWALPLGPSGLFAVSVRDVLIFAFELFVGLTLLFNRAPVRQPEKARDILVPLLGTFFIYTFAFATRAPAPLRENLMPAALRDVAAVVALLVSVVGYAVAVWSVVCLGRSFALLVSVRTLVRRGPYRYVRHPMYLGYILLFAGILIGALPDRHRVDGGLCLADGLACAARRGRPHATRREVSRIRDADRLPPAEAPRIASALSCRSAGPRASPRAVPEGRPC